MNVLFEPEAQAKEFPSLALQARKTGSSTIVILPRCLTLVLLLLSSYLAEAEEIPRLPGTAPLDWQGGLAAKMMDGLHAYIEEKIDRSIDKRPQHWKRDCSSAASYSKSVALSTLCISI